MRRNIDTLLLIIAVLSQLFLRTVSELSGGFFNVGALVTDNRDFLGNFAVRMASYPVHPQRHPPGLPLLFATARQFFDQAPELALALGNVFLQPISTALLDASGAPPVVAEAPGAPTAVWENELILEHVTVPETMTIGDTISIDVVWNNDRQIDRLYSPA